MNKTFLRNRQQFAFCHKTSCLVLSTNSEPHQSCDLHHLISFHSNKENCNVSLILYYRRCSPRLKVHRLGIHQLQLSSNTLHNSIQSGMNHNHNRIIVISFLFEPQAVSIPAYFVLSKPRRTHYCPIFNFVVGVERVELSTSRLSVVRSTY